MVYCSFLGFTNDITVNIVCLQNGSIEIGWKFDALQYDFFQVEYQCDDEGDIDDDIDWVRCSYFYQYS